MKNEQNRVARTLHVGAALLAVAVAWTALPVLRAGDGEADVPVKRIKMDVENWKWSPNTIRVQEGTKLVIEIRSFDATHRFDLKEYGLKVVVPQGKTKTVEFVADRAGEFKWKCGRPCGDGCPRMRGTLTVTEKTAAEPGTAG